MKLQHVRHPEALAREQVRQTLRGHTAPAVIDDAVTIVSELVGNAVTHTSSGPLGMFVDLYEDAAVIWVHDGDENPDAVRARAPHLDVDEEIPEHGRGLNLVDLLATMWFVWPAKDGKAVAAAIDLKPDGVSRLGELRIPGREAGCGEPASGTACPGATVPPAVPR
ncbi:ATP-binding protein [Streptomyces sp. 4N509B]|uniref:ATP-binding protein n=1 Tax=Streptomyces sp. 4N509B TaxID=3457413 RepID=UPI003FD6BCA1